MAPRKTPAPTESFEPVDARERVSDYGYLAGRGANWTAIIAIGLLICVLFVGCTTAVVGGAAYYYVNQRPDSVDPAPAPSPTTSLTKKVQDAGITPAHASYFSKVSTAVANRLAADGDSKAPVFTQRLAVSELAGDVGQLAVAGNDAAKYPQLPAVLNSAFAKVWDTDADGKLKGGALTATDRTEAVKRWRDLASAFKEVAGQ